MTQTSNRFTDQFARFVNDAASVAQGVRREAETLFRSQAERFMNNMDVVRREDFEVVREMASRAREENDRLSARIAELEARLAAAGEPAAEATAAPKTPTRRPRKPAEPGSGPAEGL